MFYSSRDTDKAVIQYTQNDYKLSQRWLNRSFLLLMRYVLATGLIVRKVYHFPIFYQIWCAISRATWPILGLFVLIWIHFLCWFPLVERIVNNLKICKHFHKNQSRLLLSRSAYGGLTRRSLLRELHRGIQCNYSPYLKLIATIIYIKANHTPTYMWLEYPFLTF